MMRSNGSLLPVGGELEFPCRLVERGEVIGRDTHRRWRAAMTNRLTVYDDSLSSKTVCSKGASSWFSRPVRTNSA
jgi:hypothetical protein